MQILEGSSKRLFFQNAVAALGLNVEQWMDGLGTPQDRGTGLLRLNRFFLRMYPRGSAEGID